jgi:hypothetical protein
MTEPETQAEPTASFAQLKAEVLADHVRSQAGELTALDVGDRLQGSEAKHGNGSMLTRRVQALRNRLAVDAFDHGMAIIACTPVLYRIQSFIAGSAHGRLELPFSAKPPDLDDVADADEVEIWIEALAVPILRRETW